VLASYAVMSQALERARSGGGPTLIEAFTYRMGAHTTSDDPTRYRTSAEDEYWRQRDPIDRLRAYLTAAGELGDDFLGALDAEAAELGRRIRTTVRAMGSPAAETMFDHVYATPHATLDAERAWFAEYEASFEPGEPAEALERADERPTAGEVAL
jgi:pyruvate dehydrogenase E1 component alpha subunit